MNPLISAQELHEQLSGPNPPLVIDVRGEDAFRAAHIKGAIHISADDVERRLSEIPRDRPVVIT